jgi:hypothetical protein
VLDATTKRLLDVILVTWTAVWVLVGVAVYREVRGLRSLADTVAVAGTSLGSTAATLDSFSAREGRRSVDRLAWLLGVAVPAVAVLPLALAYSLLRVRRR